MSRRDHRGTGSALILLGLLALPACVACFLLTIWLGDERWADTGFLAFLVAMPLIGTGLYLKGDDR